MEFGVNKAQFPFSFFISSVCITSHDTLCIEIQMSKWRLKMDLAALHWDYLSAFIKDVIFSTLPV